MLGRIPVVKPSTTASSKSATPAVRQRAGVFQGFAGAVSAPGRLDHRLLTGNLAPGVAEHLNGDYVSVYVPTTPNPTSGLP